MNLVRTFSVLLITVLVSGCLASGDLPPATSGNAPGGSVPEDETPISNSVYIQDSSRTVIEYTGSSN